MRSVFLMFIFYLVKVIRQLKTGNALNVHCIIRPYDYY